MWRLVQNFWFRLGLVFFVVMSLYSLFILLPRIKLRAERQLPQKQLVELRTAVNQNYLTYQALANQIGGNKAASIALTAAEQNLRNSLKHLEDALRHRPEQITTKQISQLKQIANDESKLLAQYSKRLATLQKPLLYIPEDDLNGSEKSLSITRSKAAYEALGALAKPDTIPLISDEQSSPNLQLIDPRYGTLQLSDQARNSLTQSADCFKLYAAELRRSSKTAHKTLAKCEKEYEVTRQEVIKAITLPLRNADGKRIQTDLTDVLRAIDKILG